MRSTCRFVKKPTFVLFFILFSSAIYAQKNDLIHYIGSAYDLKNNTLIYTDEYKEYLTDNLQLAAKVVYRYPNGDIIATKNIVYSDNFSSPSFSFSNQITGVLASILVSTSNINIRYRESFDSEFKTKTTSFQEDMVIDAGFHYFIIQNWDKLIRGKAVPIKYVSPSKQSVFSLQAKKIRSEPWKNKETTLFLLEIRNPILRLFVDNIILRYETNSRRLLTYEGLSNIKLLSGAKRVYMTISHRKGDPY